jgi:hypothetical protein
MYVLYFGNYVYVLKKRCEMGRRGDKWVVFALAWVGFAMFGKLRKGAVSATLNVTWRGVFFIAPTANFTLISAFGSGTLMLDTIQNVQVVLENHLDVLPAQHHGCAAEGRMQCKICRRRNHATPPITLAPDHNTPAPA